MVIRTNPSAAIAALFLAACGGSGTHPSAPNADRSEAEDPVRDTGDRRPYGPEVNMRNPPFHGRIRIYLGERYVVGRRADVAAMNTDDCRIDRGGIVTAEDAGEMRTNRMAWTRYIFSYRRPREDSPFYGDLQDKGALPCPDGTIFHYDYPAAIIYRSL